MMDLSLVPYESSVSGNGNRYRECMRNHAASIGGHSTDGCGEFMESCADPLKCAACGCHRSFHRLSGQLHHHLLPPPPSSFTPPPPIVRISPRMLTPSPAGDSGGRSGSETPPRMDGGDGYSMARKRMRTKFTAEQKERMREFAERLGWRIGRGDDVAIDEFCREIGVKRQVMKVWMHNNKAQLAATSASGMKSEAATGEGISV